MHASADKYGHVPIFSDVSLTAGDRELLGQLSFIRRHYPAHTDIIKEGDKSERIFLVGSGWTALYKIMVGGERQIADFPVPGDIVGLYGSDALRPSFTAITDAVVYEISLVPFIATITRSHRLTQLVLDEGARQRSILIEHMTNLGRRSALARTAHLLLELGVRRIMAGVADPGGYECPLTQYDLGDALGLTAIHINRMLRELRQADALHFHKGFVGFLAEDQLKAIAGFEPSYFTR